jgi:hypothetical protein
VRVGGVGRLGCRYATDDERRGGCVALAPGALDADANARGDDGRDTAGLEPRDARRRSVSAVIASSSATRTSSGRSRSVCMNSSNAPHGLVSPT